MEASSISVEPSSPLHASTSRPLINEHSQAVTASGPNRGTDEGQIDSAPVVLSSNQVIELTKFNQRRVHIIEQTRLLQSKPPIDPFRDFSTLEEKEHLLEEFGTELEAKREQLLEWQRDTDSIEEETEEFRGEDMNRLRKLTIACFPSANSKRPMSGHDTDLINLTMDTLEALDELLELLKERNKLLDLAFATRAWDSERLLWWKEFYSLSSSIENFVIRRARWSVHVYSRGLDSHQGSEGSSSPAPVRTFLELPPTSSPNPSSSSSPSKSQPQLSPALSHQSSRVPSSGPSKYMLVDKVELEAFRLMARIEDLALKEKAADRKLVELIDVKSEHQMGQVPDDLMDEQDKMEDRVGSMRLTSQFIQALTDQWKKADGLYHLCKALHSDAKKLVAEVERAKSREPTRTEADSLKSKSQELVKRLQALAGKESVDLFLASTISVDALSFSPDPSIPNPSHPDHPDQSVHNSTVISSLVDQLASSAKRARKAFILVGSYIKGLEAFEKVKALQAHLDQAREKYEAASLLSDKGWGNQQELSIKAEGIWKLDDSLNISLRDGSRPFLGSLESLEEDRHSRYHSNIPTLQQCISDLSLQTQHKVNQLSMAVLECVKFGITEPTFRASAEKSAAKYMESKDGAIRSATAGNARRNVLLEFRKVHNGLQSLSSHSQDLLKAIEAACDQQRFAISFDHPSRSSPFSSELTPRSAELQLRKLSESLSQCYDHERELEGMSNLDEALGDALDEAAPLKTHLQERQNSVKDQLSRLESLLAWYRALHEQATQASILEQKYLKLKDRGTLLISSIETSRIASYKESLRAIIELFPSSASSSASSAATSSTNASPSTQHSLSSKSGSKLEAAASDLRTSQADFSSQVEEFYHEVSRISFTGPPPASHLSLISSDDELRSSANSWSSELSSLKEAMERMRADADLQEASQQEAKKIAQDLAEIRRENAPLDGQIVDACSRASFKFGSSQSSSPPLSASTFQERWGLLAARLDAGKFAIEKLPHSASSPDFDLIREHLFKQVNFAQQELSDLEALIDWLSRLELQSQVAHSLQDKYLNHCNRAETLKQELEQHRVEAGHAGEASIRSILSGDSQGSDDMQGSFSKISSRQFDFLEVVKAFSMEAREYPSTGTAPTPSGTFLSPRPAPIDETLGHQVGIWCDSLAAIADELKESIAAANRDRESEARFRVHALNLCKTKAQISQLSSEVKACCLSNTNESTHIVRMPSEATAQLMDIKAAMKGNDSVFEHFSTQSSPQDAGILNHLRAYTEQVESECQALEALIAWFSKCHQQREEVSSLTSRFEDLSNQVSLLEKKISAAETSLADSDESSTPIHSLEKDVMELTGSIAAFSQDSSNCSLTGPAPIGSGASSFDESVKSSAQDRNRLLQTSAQHLIQSMERLKDQEKERHSRVKLEQEEQERVEREDIDRKEKERQELLFAQEQESGDKIKKQKEEQKKASLNAPANSIPGSSPDQSFEESVDLTRTGPLFPLSSSRKSLSNQVFPSSESIVYIDDPSPATEQRLKEDDVFGPVASRAKSEPLEAGIPASASMTSLRIRITKLLAKISNDEVEIQTVEDGRSQERKGILLPNASSNSIVQEDWQLFSSQCSALLDQNELVLPQPDGQRLARAVEARRPRVERYRLLSIFETKASAAEEVISKFIDSIDEASGNMIPSRVSPLPFESSLLSAPGSSPGSDPPQRAPSPRERIPSRNSIRSSSLKPKTISDVTRTDLQTELSSLNTIIEDVRTASFPVSGDVRVRSKAKTLDKLFNDTSEMAEDLMNPGASQRQTSEEIEADFDDAGSTISSSTSVSDSIDATSDGRQTSYETEEVKSERSPSTLDHSYDQPLTPLPRSRTQSLISPVVARSSQRSASAMLPPRHAPSSSLHMTSRLPTPLAKKRINTVPGRETPTSTPRMQKNSLSSRLPIRTPSSGLRNSSSNNRTPSSSRRVPSSSSRKASASKPRARYRANTKSALDVAVGKIVNTLPIAVNVQHASQVLPTQGIAHRPDDGFKNETGFYWVGGIDREPRKVFCRILRRSCLVRTGGGWMDLREFLHRNYSKYAQAHAQTIAAGSPQAMAAMENASGNVPWISAKTLADQNRSSRSPEEEKALYEVLRPAATPSRRRRVESMPSSPASSVNLKKNPHLRPPLPSIPFTPDKVPNGDSNLHLRTESPSYIHSATSPTPSLRIPSENPTSAQRRANSSQVSSRRPSVAATPRSSLIPEASPDQMHPLVLHRPRISSSTLEPSTPSRPAWK